LKYIEKDAEASLPAHYVDMAKKDSLKCNLLLSGCKYSTEIFKRSFWFDGEIFQHGTPRNDVLFQSDAQMRAKICGILNLPKDSKVILYAPTFRKDSGLDVYDLQYTQILRKLQTKFGGEWRFLVRLHPHLISKSKELVRGDNVLDVTVYPDIQELLSISDILISDYSSVVFDFSLTGRPCFLYIPDVLDYVNNDRKLYFDIRLLPFISASGNDDLLDELEKFDYKKYNYKLKSFLESIGSFESGRASEKLLKHIDKVCFN
jgi:CDP-glycerol glycerophosphotransferase